MTPTTRRYTVRVTREDIKKGNPTSARYCALARAISRVTGLNVIVSFQWFQLWSEGDDWWSRDKYPLPPIAVKFVHDYTSRTIFSRIKPISFELEVPA